MLLWIGLAAAVVAVVCGALARRSNGRVKALESVETLPVGDLEALHEAAAGAAGAGFFRQPCEVVGAARPNEDGPLRSELSQLECVWHHHKVTRRYEETYRDNDGNRRRRTRTDVVADHATSTPFYVEDATGKLLVHPGKQKIDGAEKVQDTFEPYEGRSGGRITFGSLVLSLGSRSDTIGYDREEWVLRPGARVFAHGEAGDETGRLVLGAPAEGGVFILSTRTEGQLVRRENNHVLGWGIGAGVTGVAGVVLLILAAVL
ncbi:GIDE domain-containing protein [Streptomyces sp. NPDC093109]|uniref:GIDE domain-containing protein n=1 Tax=Streptomyces sp. NPDC093109 TaxID=3154977 RepID=UPI003450AF7F